MSSPSTARRNVITFHIPKDCDEQLLHSFAAKYRALRLAALRLSPEAFGSTLAAEAQYPDEVWTSRLRNPQFETFICAVAPSTCGSQNEFSITDNQLEWVGQATLRGPSSVKEFTLPVESGQAAIDPGSEDSEERWQILALYTIPSFRGQGLARQLCEEAFRWLTTSRLRGQPVVQAVRVRTMIKDDNLPSLALFRKLGFVDDGLCTRAEGMVANGESVPEEWDEEDPRRTYRGGCILSLGLGS